MVKQEKNVKTKYKWLIALNGLVVSIHLPELSGRMSNILDNDFLRPRPSRNN